MQMPLKTKKEPTPAPSKEGNLFVPNVLNIIPSWEGYGVGGLILAQFINPAPLGRLLISI
jgi:hypothetical protein